MNPKVFIIVLNWNGFQDTIECVNSVKAISYPNYRVILVDNGSTDDSETLLRERFPGIELIQTGQNLGFTGGNNIGMRHALGNGADYIILLNNDTIVDKDFVTALVNVAEADKTAGMLCSKIFFHDRPDFLWYAGASFHPWLGWGRHRGYNVRDEGQFDTVEETARPTGCSLMVSRRLCEHIGLLAEKFFCYCEDLDWGMRAQNAGYKVMYVPASRVWHKISRSTGGSRSGLSLYYYVRNMLLCLDSNRPLPFLLRQVRYGLVFVAACLSLFTNDLPKTIGTKQICRGAVHYFHGKFGELKKSR
jgi:GT2 family glycosyltransferase